MEIFSLPYKNYTVWSDGRIQNSKGAFLNPYISTGRNGNKYHKVQLCTGEGHSRYGAEIWFVHRLMAWVFLGPFDDFFWAGAIVDHIDMNTLNNRLDNVDVVDCRENLRRAREERNSVPF